MTREVVLDEAMARRVAEAVRWVESMRSRLSAEPSTPSARTLPWVRCTSATPDGNGNYPGVVTYHDGSAWQDEPGAVALKIADGTAATSGRRYLASPSTEQSDGPVYITESSVYDYVTHTRVGIISLADQYIGAGIKSFDSVRVAYTDGSPSSTDPRLDAIRSTDTGELDAGHGTALEVLGGITRRNPLMASSLWVDADAGAGSWLWDGTGNAAAGPTTSAYMRWGWRGSSANANPLADCYPMIFGVGSAAPSLGGFGAVLDTTYGWLQVGGVIEATYHNVGFITSARFRCRGLDGATGTDLTGSTVTGGIITAIGSALASNSVVTASITDASVTYAKIQNVTANRILGRFSTSGPPQELSVNSTLEIVAGPTLGIKDAGVTLAKMADLANKTIIARKTAASGVPESCTLSEVLDFIGSTAQGDILYRGAAGWARLAAGTSGKFLKTLGAGADPAWDAPALDITGLTDADPALGDSLPIYDLSATANRETYLGRVLGLPRRGPGGRLSSSSTLAEGSDSTGVGTLYYLPFRDDCVTLWDGTRWVVVNFSGATVSKALSSLTSGKPYDVFGYLNSGVLNLEFLVWTNDSTRATGVSLQDGLWCKTGDKTRLYLGSFYTTATNATSDSVAERYVYNAYNRIRKEVYVNPTYNDNNAVNSVSVTSTTLAQINGGTNVTFSWLDGLGQEAVDIRLHTFMDTPSGQGITLGIGYDSTSTAYSLSGAFMLSGGQTRASGTCALAFRPVAGKHYATILGLVSGGTGTVHSDLGRLGGSSDARGTMLQGSVMG